MSRQAEHGTTLSYIIGFLLSLVLTAIPYYLVTHNVLSSGVLLITILAVAVMQMVVQVIFFLHLGRGPKPLYNVVFLISTVGVVMFVVTASVWIIHHLNYNMAPIDMSKNLVNQEGIPQINGQKTGACQQIRANHLVVISNGVVSPIHTEAKLCDSLTFLEQDGTERKINFGSPAQPAYAGETELTLRKGRGETITLSEAGTYLFHDKLKPDVLGTFTVTP
jgi:cytochrome o ubiquinol oxidase operon protein cyoD